MDQNLTTFIEDLLKEKGLPDDLEPEVKEELVRDITERANSRVMTGILARMSDTHLAEYEQLLDTDAPEEQLQACVRAAVPNLEAVVAAELVDFRQLYLGVQQ